MYTTQVAHSHTLAGCYKVFLQKIEEQPLSFVASWEKELGRTFNTEERDQNLRLVSWTLVSNMNEKSSYKILSGWYQTPHILNCIHLNHCDCCWRCEGAQGNMLHIFWSCPILTYFWSQVCKVGQKFTDNIIWIFPLAARFLAINIKKINIRQSSRCSVRLYPGWMEEDDGADD